MAIVLCLATWTTHAQYYYKDIISNKQLMADMTTYKQKKVHNIRIKSFESNGEPSEGFYCEKKISRDFRTSELYTKTDIASRSLFTSYFDDNGRILRSMDSSEISLTENTYDYNPSGKIIKISSSAKSSDDDFTNELLEEHIYKYDDKGGLAGMFLVKNRRDTTKFLFSLDEKNNVALEKNTKDGSKYYYYYDSNNRLTDIAHTNEFREKMVADYLFEYDQSGLLVQMTVTEEGRGKEVNDTELFYSTWRYINEDGLRVKEGLFSKEGKLVGSVEYSYK